MGTKQLAKWKSRIGILLVIGFFSFFLFLYAKTFFIFYNKYGEREKIFGATYMTMNNEFYSVLNNELSRQIEKNGDRLITLDPALDQEKQNQQIKYLVKKKVDAIFINPVDWKEVESGLKAAKKAGIPVIVIDAPVYNDELVTTTIVSDNYQAGVQCARDMMKKRKGANIVLLTHKEAKSGVDRINGFLDTINRRSEYQVIAETDTQGQIERALPKVEKIVEQYDDIDVIMALNDPAAMGALAALDSKNCREGVLVYGVDGSPEAKKLISEGMMTGTSAQFPKKMGQQAIKYAYKILKGETVERKVVVPVKMITKKNIEEFDVDRWQ